MNPYKRKRICHKCHRRYKRSWDEYVCPECGEKVSVTARADQIRNRILYRSERES